MFASNTVNPSKSTSVKPSRKIGQTPTQVEQYGDWTLEFTRKMVGSTVRRELISVRVQGKEPFEKAFLSNFPSMGSARKAAYVAIGELALKYSNNSERKRIDVKHSLLNQRRIRQQAKHKRSRNQE